MCGLDWLMSFCKTLVDRFNSHASSWCPKLWFNRLLRHSHYLESWRIWVTWLQCLEMSCLILRYLESFSLSSFSWSVWSLPSLVQEIQIYQDHFKMTIFKQWMNLLKKVGWRNCHLFKNTPKSVFLLGMLPKHLE